MPLRIGFAGWLENPSCTTGRHPPPDRHSSLVTMETLEASPCQPAFRQDEGAMLGAAGSSIGPLWICALPGDKRSVENLRRQIQALRELPAQEKKSFPIKVLFLWETYWLLCVGTVEFKKYADIAGLLFLEIPLPILIRVKIAIHHSQ